MTGLGVLIAGEDGAAVAALVRLLERAFPERVRVHDGFRDREGTTVLQVMVVEITEAGATLHPFPRRR